SGSRDATKVSIRELSKQGDHAPDRGDRRDRAAGEFPQLGAVRRVELVGPVHEFRGDLLTERFVELPQQPGRDGHPSTPETGSPSRFNVRSAGASSKVRRTGPTLAEGFVFEDASAEPRLRRGLPTLLAPRCESPAG